jgi:hypothetical protein
MPSRSTTKLSQILFIAHLFYQSSAVTTENLWQAIPNAPQAAFIIDVSAAATTYVLGCGENFPAEVSGIRKEELCPSLASLTITQGLSTLAYASPVNMATGGVAAPTMIKENMNCALSAKTAAVCTVKYEGLNKIVAPAGMDADMSASFKSLLDSLKTPQTTTLLGADYPVFGPVAITGGAEKLSGGLKQVSTADATGEAGASVGPGRQPSSSTSAGDVVSSLETNPAGGGVNTSVPKKTTSGE